MNARNVDLTPVAALMLTSKIDAEIFCNPCSGITVCVVAHPAGSTFVDVAVATCSERDDFNITTGMNLAFTRWNEGKCITLNAAGMTKRQIATFVAGCNDHCCDSMLQAF